MVRLRQRSNKRIITATVLSLGLIAAACGSDSKSSPTVASTGETTAASPETTAASGGTETTAAAPAESSAPTTAAAAKPVAGGSVVMGIEADTSSPWRPYEMLCAISCHQVIRNIYDTLAMPTADGKAAPYLAESITPNADSTEWTIKARAGVTFHDGTPFDGAAIVENLTRAKTGALTGNILRPIDSVTVDAADPLTVHIKMNTSWAAFPFALMGQASYMASPAWLAASDTNEALRSQPVGTGPFMYVDYKPNEYFKMNKNPNYWNKPYPYLDSVEFRPIPDALNRRDALKSGTIDILHTTNGETIAEMRDTKEFPMEEITNTAETAYTLLHVTQDGSPLNDVRVRCALAYASDEQAIIDSISAGVGQLASGPFSPDQVGYLADTGFPLKQDMAKAQDLIAQYKVDHPGKLTLSLAATQDETNLTIAQFQKQWYEEAGIDEVTIDQIDQGNYILTAVLGNFQVFQWRNHGGIDLDMQYHWWHSSSSLPVGQLALNFGRIKDPQLDALLDENRASTDPVRKKAIAEEVNKLFATQCYNIWGAYTIWGTPHKADVQGVGNFKLPDGSEGVPGAGIAGTFYMMTVWRGGQ
ncbi:MAG: ABC transporter substrate-binding protein [Ilumatobacteraceae bacterium]